MNEFHIVLSELQGKVSNLLKQANNSKTIYSIFDQSLKEFYKKIKSNPSQALSYLDDYEILLGFEEFQRKRQYKITSLSIKNSKKLREFVCFVYMLDILLTKVDSKGRKELFGKLKKHLIENMKAWLHELETFVHLRQLGFSVDLSELEKTTKTEYIASKNKQSFNIECKSVSKYAGFPIIRAKVGDFLKKLDLKSIEKPCIIKYAFIGRLVSKKQIENDFLPEELAVTFNQDLQSKANNLTVEKINKKLIFDDEWMVNQVNALQVNDPSSLVLFSLNAKLPIFIQLKSKNNSDYVGHIISRVEKALKQFQENQNSNPDVLFIYLEGVTAKELENKILQNKLNQIIGSIVNSYSKPLLIIFRSQKDELGISKNFPLWNQDFSWYESQFETMKN
jgi:hypothetical protein